MKIKCRLIIVFLTLKGVVLFAQNSGTLLYTEHKGEILTLIAGHKKLVENPDHYLRGWASFGGTCKENETIKDCAIRETTEETNSMYKIQDLDEQLQVFDNESNFTLYIKEVVYIDADQINNKSNKERGPYAWVNLEELLGLVYNSNGDRVDLSYLSGLPENAMNKWLYPKFAKSLNDIPDEVLNRIFGTSSNAVFSTIPESDDYYGSDLLSKYYDEINDSTPIETENYDSSDTKYIIFNAAENNFKKPLPKSLSQKESLEVVIKDVNLFLYKVLLTESQNDQINTEVLSEVKLSNSFSLDNFNVKDVYLNLSGFPSNSFGTNSDLKKIMLSLEDQEHQLSFRQEILKDISKRLNELKIIDVKIDELKETLGDTSLEYKNEVKKLFYKFNVSTSTDIEEEINSLNSEYDTYLKSSRDDQLKVTNLRNQLNRKSTQIGEIAVARTEFTKYLKNYQKAVNDLNGVIAFYEKLVCILHTNQSFYKIQEAKDVLTSDFIYENQTDLYFNYTDDGTNLLDILYGKLKNLSENYDALSNAYIEVKNKDGTTGPKGIDNVYTYIKTINASINHDVYRSFFRQIVKTHKLISKENFELKFRTNIVSDNADNIKHFINLIPIEKLPCALPPQPVSFNYKIKIRQGIKIDSGPTIFGNIGLSDNTYRFNAVEVLVNSVLEQYTQVIKEKDQNAVRPTVGYLFNIYCRMKHDIKPAFSIGFSTDDIKRLNYHVGLSLLFGQSERVSLTGGLTLGQVNFVVDEYNQSSLKTVIDSNGNEISNLVLKPRSDLPEEVPLMESSPFRAGWFIGVTFNLSGSKNSERVTKITTF
uniref:NUDIX hydrolase n=1 Tax=Fulvivirga sp. TaxID=1931237 RepID=UPI00404909CD